MASNVFFDVNTLLYDSTAVAGAISISVNDPTQVMGSRSDAGNVDHYVPMAGEVVGSITIQDVIEAGKLDNMTADSKNITCHVSDKDGVDYLLTLTGVKTGGVSANYNTPASPVSVSYRAQSMSLAAV